MKKLAILMVCGALVTGSAGAQDGPPTAPQNDTSEGLGMIGRGIGKLFGGLKSDAAPAIDGLGGAMRDLVPMLQQLAALIGDVANYEAPARLPNGDILIRRKPDAPPPPPDPAPKDGIDL